MTDTGRKFYSVELTNIEKTVCPPPEDEADFVIAYHFIEQSPTKYLIRRLIEFAHAAFDEFQFMYLTVMLSHLPLIKIISNPRGAEIARYAIRVDMMRLIESERNPLLLCDIAIGIFDFDIGVDFLQPIEK